MKIDNSYLSRSGLYNAGNTTRKASTAVAGGTQAGGDTVSLSELSGTIKSGTAESSSINSARVQEIKEAIAQGRFKINADAIAGGLLDMARDLVSSGQGARV